MKHRFTRHYTRDEARALLPAVREWLDRLARLTEEGGQLSRRVESLQNGGADIGGRSVNDWLSTMAATQEVLAEFRSREIQIKDLERGLIDFPAVIGGREVLLCWERGEEDIEHWHDLDSGYQNRQAL